MAIQKQAQDYDKNLIDDLFADDLYVDESMDDDSDEIEVNEADSEDDYLVEGLPEDEQDEQDDDSVAFDSEELEGGDIVVMDLPGNNEAVFIVPEIPGAMDASEIEEPEEEEELEEEKKDIDPFDWKSQGGHAGFLTWLKKMVSNTPRHSGRDIAGLERAMSYAKLLIKEISKAMQSDFRGEVDNNECENISDGLYKAIDAMENRKEQLFRTKYPRKKKSWVESAGIVKEAKSTNITGISITVPLFISSIARTIINGAVSAGHSIEDMYDDLKKEYDLTKREEFELQQLLYDMGYPIRRDRGRLNEQLDQTKSDNFDYSAQYNA